MAQASGTLLPGYKFLRSARPFLRSLTQRPATRDAAPALASPSGRRSFTLWIGFGLLDFFKLFDHNVFDTFGLRDRPGGFDLCPHHFAQFHAFS